MKFIKKFDQYITAIYFLTIIIVIATSYFTFKEFFSSHNKRQQEVIIPLFSLMTNEIIRPLTASQYMANDSFLIDYIQQEHIDINILFNYLTKVSQRFNIVSFVAIEEHKLLIDSNGKNTSLSDDSAEWYARLKAIDKNQFTDIGDVDNPHLFFDVKMFNEQEEFLGFVGVAIDLNHFATKFAEFHQRFGFELFFVDDDNVITLTSNQLMKTDSHHRKNETIKIDSLPWYAHFKNNQKNKTLKNQTPIISSIENDELMISEIPIKDLNWRVFLVASPATQQNEYWQLFVRNLIILLLVSIALYSLFIITINYFKSNLVKDSETDYLTQLPNRSYIHWKFSALNKIYKHVSVVLADIDNFKQVNDTYGHLFGDDVLKVIAKELGKNLRDIDLVGRWGGEEFILILPNTNAKQAQEIINRIRQNIEVIPFAPASTSTKFNVTVSFGISESNLAKASLQNILVKADKALYSAKNNGRNQVVVHLE